VRARARRRALSLPRPRIPAARRAPREAWLPGHLRRARGPAQAAADQALDQAGAAPRRGTLREPVGARGPASVVRSDLLRASVHGAIELARTAHGARGQL